MQHLNIWPDMIAFLVQAINCFQDTGVSCVYYVSDLIPAAFYCTLDMSSHWGTRQQAPDLLSDHMCVHCLGLCESLLASCQCCYISAVPEKVWLCADCLKGANIIHAAVGIGMSLLFALISLTLSVADGSDLNPHSKAYYASPCGQWTFRRAFAKSALVLIAAALPNYIHLRVRTWLDGLLSLLNVGSTTQKLALMLAVATGAIANIPD